MKRNLLTIIMFTTLATSVIADDNICNSELHKYSNLKKSLYSQKLENKRDLLSQSRDKAADVRDYKALKRVEK